MSIFGDIHVSDFRPFCFGRSLDLGAFSFPGAASFASAIRHHDKD
jgi:hypothetical protein